MFSWNNKTQISLFLFQQILWFSVNNMDWCKCTLCHQDASQLLDPFKNKIFTSADGYSNLANNIQAFINENVTQQSKTKVNVVDLKQNDSILLIYPTTWLNSSRTVHLLCRSQNWIVPYHVKKRGQKLKLEALWKDLPRAFWGVLFACL